MKDYATAEEVVSAYHDGDIHEDQVIEWFKNKTGNVYVHTEDTDEFVERDKVKEDQESGIYYSLDANFKKVYNNVDNHSSFILRYEDNMDDTFYCEQTCRYYDESVFESVNVEGSQVCYQVCRDDIYWWDRDEEYHWDSEPSDDEESDIPEYHSYCRPTNWRNIKGLGVELEIFSENRKELHDSLPSGIFGETDGSLDDTCGIELVGPPFVYELYKIHETPWKKTIETALSLGSKAGKPLSRNKYGMHVSISRKLFTDFSAAKFIVFMNMQAELCKLIAQRDNIYEGDYFMRKTPKDCVVYTDTWGDYSPTKVGNYKKRMIKTEKYEAVKADDHRLEVRIFKSTLNYEKFLKNVEFVQAVKEWTTRKTTSAKIVARNTITEKYPTGTSLFFEWLNDQEDYSNLKKYLVDSAPQNSHIIGINKIKV